MEVLSGKKRKADQFAASKINSKLYMLDEQILNSMAKDSFI